MIELKIQVAIFGLLIGSFLNVIIYRLPRLMNITWVRSSCTRCGKTILWYENIPVVSYLFLLGKCSVCKNSIPLRYPIVELVTGLAAWFLAPESMDGLTLGYFLFYFAVFCSLLALFVIDLQHQILPDGLNLFLALCFALYAYFHYPWTYPVLGGLIGYCLPYFITWLFYVWRGVIGLGGGDIKLFGALGLYLGPAGVIHNMVFSCGLGAILGGGLLLCRIIKRDQPIPFGPFIIIIAMVQIYFPQYFHKIMTYIFG